MNEPPFDQIDRTTAPASLSTVILLALLGLMLAGPPIAWLVLSPKSVLRSKDSTFINGFGAGLGTGFAAPVGVVLLGLAWSQFLRRHSPAFRRKASLASLLLLLAAVAASYALGLAT
jgi:hypothetical protein